MNKENRREVFYLNSVYATNVNYCATTNTC